MGHPNDGFNDKWFGKWVTHWKSHMLNLIEVNGSEVIFRFQPFIFKGGVNIDTLDKPK